MTGRRAHLVGSLPGGSAAEAMRTAVERLGPHLRSLPDGETGERRNWVISMIEALRGHPDLELVKQGDWSDYDRTPRFKVRPGRRLYGAALDLGIAAAARAARPEYVALREAGGDTPLAFQVGIPGDLDLALFTFGPAGALRQTRPFTEALAATMHETHALYGDDVLFQIEIPAELVLLARAPAAARPPLARLLARRVTAVALGAPEGARFGLHLCLGDMNHQAFGRIADAAPLTLLAAAVLDAWPAGRRLEYVHAPLAHADAPPTTDPAFYAPLSGLRLPPGVAFVAGFAHEDQDLAEQFRIRAAIEDALGGPAGVSTSCGLGRRQPAAALAALDRIGVLVGDPPG